MRKKPTLHLSADKACKKLLGKLVRWWLSLALLVFLIGPHSSECRSTCIQSYYKVEHKRPQRTLRQCWQALLVLTYCKYS
jgi:hypothetical protein